MRDFRLNGGFPKRKRVIFWCHGGFEKTRDFRVKSWILEGKTRDFLVKWGICEEKTRDFRFNGGFEKTRDFRLNVGFTKRKRVIFT